MNLFNLILTFKIDEIPSEVGQVLYSSELKSMLVILRNYNKDGEFDIVDFKSLDIKKFSEEPLDIEILEIGKAIVKKRYGEDYETTTIPGQE